MRRRGSETFSMGASPPTSSVPPPAGVNPQPFTLDPAVSREDPNNSRFQIAELVFIGNIDDWHVLFFDPCRKLSQTMQVADGVGPMELPIELSCTAHPLPLAAQIRGTLEAVKDAVVTMVTAPITFARRFVS